MRRYAVAALSAVTVLASSCGGRGSGEEPLPRGARSIARPLEIYQQLGMLAGPTEFPAVARFATLAGAADSTLLLLTVSLPNSAVRFQRDETGFNAEYRVSAAIVRDSQQVSQIERREIVRVSSFTETGRSDESIVFQDFLMLKPDTYTVRLQVSDVNSSRGFQALDTIVVPAYSRSSSIGTPLLVYQAEGREHVGDRPDIILNPRNTIPYGDEAPRIYLEFYGTAAARPVALRLVDDAGSALWSTQTVATTGTAELRHSLVEIPPATLPLGRLWLEVRETPEATPVRTPLVVTISDQWMVANFEDVLRFLEFIAYPAEIDSLRKAVGTERRDRWDRFWARRDPVPATQINEYRDQFFERIRTVTDLFSENGRTGWETDRGEVYVVLGPPDQMMERQIGRGALGQPNLIEWLYEGLPGGRLTLQFIDRTGFGRFDLTQSSESTFRTIAARLRPRL